MNPYKVTIAIIIMAVIASVIALAMDHQSYNHPEAIKDSLPVWDDTTQVTITEKIDDGLKNKIPFFYNLYYGMPEDECYDSIIANPLYEDGNFLIKQDYSGIQLKVNPTIYSGYLIGMELDLKQYKEDFGASYEPVMFYRTEDGPVEFSIHYCRKDEVENILNMFNAKYGSPVINKRSLATPVPLDYSVKAKFESQFPPDGYSEQNYKNKIESDLNKMYGGMMEDLTIYEYTYKGINNSEVLVTISARERIDKIKQGDNDIRYENASIQYKPNEQVQIEEKSRADEQGRQENLKQQRDLEKQKSQEDAQKIL